jgi:hypothetical protein
VATGRRPLNREKPSALAEGVFTIPLFLWNRSEARQDIKHMDSTLKSFRAENYLLIKAIDNHVMAIHQEIKDFHERLCAIEERNRDIKEGRK